MPRRKALKTGSRTRGRGHKKGRGAGLRGGRGNAGCHKTKRIMYERVGRIWGAHGFKRPQTVVMANNAINLKVIEESAAEWVDQGNASKKGKVVSIDLKKMGYDKLLGTGVPSQAYKITISAASAKAVEKVEAAGGEVING
ncbi:MAG: uL15m family ribosomal protein [Candidatus Thermoplasmatota archaeon]|nr:uL15m family ribosomal protein [Candidatus Thermoplasmatota archaeon]MEC7350084.1 uL15m family ribosomal protein [Candidatus Thermoplasmatota archaeon]MEC7494163.1 uL15m family ribosomal protein [Candidatus Thermoplasmatota archaeon]MEC7698174.1 uL15m family ribosomal protein [Candidatus Thermoplasmatota archaeon]MEC7976962.1 uL15m family ribosomal protein [Candidatus Thermoplasmatota archaeon]